MIFDSVDNNKILFYNEAALSYKNAKRSLLDSAFESEKPSMQTMLTESHKAQFAPIDREILDQQGTVDYEKSINQIKEANDYISLQKILKTQQSIHLSKKIFKIASDEGEPMNQNENLSLSHVKVKKQYVMLQIRKQVHASKPAFVVYMRDKTESVRKKLLQMQRLDTRTVARQTEQFTSTVSHEMRAPIQTIMFFLKGIIEMLSASPFDESHIPDMLQKSKLMMGQLTFLYSFVADLLDQKQLKFGAFNLVQQPFDVQAMIMDIFSIFSPQMSLQNVKLQASLQGHRIDKVSKRKTLLIPKLVGDERRLK